MTRYTKAPTTRPNTTLDHPYPDLQITMLQLTEQVKQLQRGLGVPTNLQLPESKQSSTSTIPPISENKIRTMEMDTNTLPPTTPTNIILDHPHQNLQTTVLQLTEQVKQLQRELGVQIGKFNERVRPMEAYLKNEEKKKQRLEARKAWVCGTGLMKMEQNRKRRGGEKKRGTEVEWGFLMGGGAKREIRKKNNVTAGLDPIIARNDMGTTDVEGREGGGEPSRGGRVSGSCQVLCEALEEQK